MIYKELEKLGIVIKKFDIETLFDNEIHKQRYKELVDRGEFKDDWYAQSLFFILASKDDLYVHANQIYDFEAKSINREFGRDFLTSGTYKLIALAFELYTNSNILNKSLSDIFSSLDNDYFNIAINAIRVRFRQMP